MKVLHEGKYVSLVDLSVGYETLKEKDIVISFVKKVSQFGETLYAVRYENCPPYSEDENYYTIISGKIDEGETPMDACIRELVEEAGVKILNKDIVNPSFEKIPVCKSTMMRTNLYIITLNEDRKDLDWEETEATGDGTEFEGNSETQWLTMDELINILNNNSNFDVLYYLACFVYQNA